MKLKQLDAIAIDALGRPFIRYGPRKARQLGRLLWAIRLELDVDEDSKPDALQVQLAECLAQLARPVIDAKPHIPQPRSIWKQKSTPPEKLVQGSPGYAFAVKQQEKRRAEEGIVDCAYCNTEITNARPAQRYCSAACRNRAWRVAQKPEATA